jgi:hypothetical protein
VIKYYVSNRKNHHPDKRQFSFEKESGSLFRGFRKLEADLPSVQQVRFVGC